MPHLPTPENLPPGTTQAPSEGSKLGYIRDLWYAVRTQDVTMSDAVLLFTQRPMDADTPLDAMSPRSEPIPVPDPAAPPAADAHPRGSSGTAGLVAGPEASTQTFSHQTVTATTTSLRRRKGNVHGGS